MCGAGAFARAILYIRLSNLVIGQLGNLKPLSKVLSITQLPNYSIPLHHLGSPQIVQVHNALHVMIAIHYDQ